jgi:hypothetical protein
MVNAIADIDEWHDEDETEANARVVAAAPQLLETLIALDAYLRQPFWERQPEESEALQKIEEVLAKVDGRG